MVSLKSFFTTLFFSAATTAMACTNLIVGKNASVDGSVMCTYNCDGYGFAGSLSYSAPGRHAKGEKLALTSFETGQKILIDQVEYTYKVVGLMNECQVSIVETTFDGRLELVNEKGALDYYTMMELGLQRSATAREAIYCMTELVAKYGYNSSGETITICDPQEAWIMEIIGMGPDRQGAVWVARRIPDDCICAHANISRIRQFPQTKKLDKQHQCYIVGDSCIYSREVISFAREKGFYNGSDQDFSFRDAYCPIDFENVRYADARVWSFFRHHYDKNVIDSYLPYINGEFDKCDHLPLWIKPDQKLSMRDLQQDMRDHFEGNALDMTADMSAGPWGMPIRPMPLSFKASDGTPMFTERPIATQKSAMTMCCQMRSWLPNEVGGVTYFNCDDANMVAYVPCYCSIDQVPAAFARENNPHNEFTTKSAFWMNNFVANMVYPRYSMMIGDLREAQKELEDYYEQDQEQVIAAVKELTPGERVTYLTQKSAQYTERMMQRWDELSKLLIVKYNDQVAKPSEGGKVVRGKMTYPGYDQKFNDAILRETGDRYKLKVVIERRER